MPITKLTPENNYPYLQDRLQQLEQAVPEAFTDGKINWDTLREILNADLEDEGRDEYFGLNWPGKREARKRAATPSHGTLVPAPGEGVNEDTTENLFIEGDNLEVLKLLQKSYAGKIKMIYIDPPYNTGNDFIYNDDFTDPLEAYLQYTGAKGESGELLTTNTRADGRFHSKWLNMMYPRLILARQLLREDGIIFVSIDDNEVHNLRQMMAEIFGDENFVAVFPWNKRTAKSDVPFGVSQDYEWILSFAKSEFLGGTKFERKYFQTNDFPNDRWRLSDLTTQRTAIERPNSAFNMVNPKTGKTYPFNPNRIWGVTKDTFNEYYTKGKIVFPEDYDFLRINTPAFRVFESEDKLKAQKKYSSQVSMKAVSTNLPETVGRSEDGNKEIIELFGNKIFSYPKPTSLIKYLISNINDSNGIILDFFAGSCSSAQAVLQLNVENGEKLQFIMVQIPEITLPNSEARIQGYKNIAEVGKQRIRLAIHNIQNEINPQLPLQGEQKDLGFKVYKYARSNYKKWAMESDSVQSLTSLFDNLRDPIIFDWKIENLLSEILLLEGFPLTSKITYLEDHLQNQVYRVTTPDFCDHDLFVCLDETIQPATVNLLKMEKEDIFICLDSALSDELKARVQDKFNVHVI
jgi:adenine-specific DNA-methyltransferase